MTTPQQSQVGGQHESAAISGALHILRVFPVLYSACVEALFSMGREGANGDLSHPLRKAWEACSEADRAVADLGQVHGVSLPDVVEHLRHAQAAAPGVQGWKLVPVEPTEEMFIEGMEADCLGRPSVDDETHVRSIWDRMLAAAPPLPKSQPLYGAEGGSHEER